jgi:hypothetical protein
MAEDCHEWIGDRAQQPLGLALAILPELAMDAGDDEVEPAQHVVGIVQRPVAQDVGLNALEDAEMTVQSGVEPIDLGVLFLDFCKAQAAGIVRGFEWSATPKY